MINTIGNGIKIAFEAIKLVFTRWYSYVIAVLYGATAYGLSELIIYVEKYYWTQQHPHLAQGIVTFGFDSYFDFFVSIFKGGLWIASIKVLMVPSLILFIDALMSQYRKEPVLWRHLILKFFKYSIYSLPVMILWAATSQLIFQVLGKGIIFDFLPVLVATLLGFYVALSVDSKKIFVSASECLHIFKANFFNYCGFLLIWLPLAIFLTYFAETIIRDFFVRNEIIFNFSALPHFLYLFMSFCALLFIQCAAITLMYLRTSREAHDKLNH